MTQEEHDVVDRVISQKDAEIEQLKALCTRAADVLEEEFGSGKVDLMTKDPWVLIAELRKVAQ